MKKIIASTILAIASTGAVAAPMTMIDQGANFDYQTLSTDLYTSSWDSIDYSTFDFNTATGWSNGNAAFGNRPGDYTTYWAADTDLALQTEFDFSGVASDLTLNVASDNGFVIFLNGTKIAQENDEGYTSYWEYTLNIDPSLLLQGSNSIQVLAEDHGVLTFFDMKLSSSNVVASVPEPATITLLAAGLIGLSRIRRN